MLTVPLNEKDHVLGADRPLVSLVEFGDYQCPFCGRAQPIVRDILQSMSQELLFAFRHFPLVQAHPHAMTAAMAAEAAGAQGQFWPMHDALFEDQEALSEEDLVTSAESLDLDVGRFVADIEGSVYLPKIRDDFRGGVRSGVNGTPTFFIDGRRFDGNWADGGLALALTAIVRSRARGVAGESASPHR